MASISQTNDSTIESLLDEAWSSRSVLTSPVAPLAPLSVPPSAESSTSSTLGVESEKPLGSSSEADGARRRYSFHKSEMRKVFDKFDENGDGLISREELGRWWTKCCQKDVSGSDVDCMISSVDRNNDGVVDFEEFLSLFETHCSSLGEQEDDSKRARENEAEKEEEDLMLQAFRVFDKNHDGFISPKELQAVLVQLRMPEGKNLSICEKMISQVDRNGDGQCDMQEFQEMMSALHLRK